MTLTTIVSTDEVAKHLNDPSWALIDCRFQLDDPDAGRLDYLKSHVPGAIYAHLDDDLSGPIVAGKTGRHPLPDMDAFVNTLSHWGIDESTQVIAYDTNSAVYAGRLWWMLRWLGHDQVAVLDGDFRQWLREGRPTSSGDESRSRRQFRANPRPQMAVSVDDVVANLTTKKYQLYDARDEARFRGEVAGMDPVAGHIPGAKSAFYGPNLTDDGKFRSPAELGERYKQLLGDNDPQETIWYCGSGVSVHHDLLAMEIAGFKRGARVYIGSWSDWINDSERPVATGEE